MLELRLSMSVFPFLNLIYKNHGLTESDSPTMTCDLCFTRGFSSYNHLGLNLCLACVDELSELNCSQGESSALAWKKDGAQQIAKIDSLFWYSGIVRTLTISAKVKGDLSSLNKILQIWMAEIENKSALEGVEAVMPCPSSLWSRLHGRVDVAWFLAARTAKRYNLKFFRPPRSIYWNMEKRSQSERPVSTNLVMQGDDFKIQDRPETGGHCLIIDDVVTTGATLRECIEHASAMSFGRFSSLTFARAR